MSLRFVPPKEDAKSLPRYGSYVVGSGLKVHNNLSAAKNSWRNRGWEWSGGNPDALSYTERRGQHVTKHAFILENVDGLWYTLYEIKPGLTEQELPWYRDVWVHKTYRWTYNTEPSYNLSEFDKVRKPFPMSRDEYVQFRLAIQKEQLQS